MTKNNECSKGNIVPYDIVKQAYKDTQRGSKKFKKEAILFDMCRERNLVQLWRDLNNDDYEVGDYIRFKVYEPKERVISAPRIVDKIVQFILHYQIVEIYDPIYIKGSFACQKGKGTHKSVEHLQHAMKVCKWKYGEENCVIIKADVRKFFYSIDRDILKKVLAKKVKDETLLKRLFKVIDSSPEGETGIPLGNVTSQDFANIYLNELDQYCVRYLGIKYYTRYMDDVVIIVPPKIQVVDGVKMVEIKALDRAREWLDKIKKYLNEKLNLKTNDKTQIFPLSQGVNAFGFKIHTTHRLVRDQSKRAMKRRIKAMDKKLQNDEIELKEITQAVNSWLGHARHSNSYNLAKKIFAAYSYIKVEGEIYFGGIFRNSIPRGSV
ncbi:RNA-directed DNA polymerase [Tissierella carlieri]|uniref:RNA-directed DNA polymerase n=1 Tax=Tissierella carlieri TaxID=689904 RepID=A0ABT1SC56_9FIRM|nr:RNA-directed DNA polymerase [Tissierella carlieri]MCQ4924071.1 RNA-directed DNA polymerase [Tissierella carlieri]